MYHYISSTFSCGSKGLRMSQEFFNSGLFFGEKNYAASKSHHSFLFCRIISASNGGGKRKYFELLCFANCRTKWSRCNDVSSLPFLDPSSTSGWASLQFLIFGLCSLSFWLSERAKPDSGDAGSGTRLCLPDRPCRCLAASLTSNTLKITNRPNMAKPHFWTVEPFERFFFFEPLILIKFDGLLHTNFYPLLNLAKAAHKHFPPNCRSAMLN